MARRRPDLPTYLKRRWRIVGFFLVLLAGSLLVLAITERGHDPVWSARDGTMDQVAPAPDAAIVYSLVREDDVISRLQARRGTDGELLWESPLNASRALLAANANGAVVATDRPRAFLTHYAQDGAVRYQLPLNGTPRAVSADDAGRIAVAVQGPGNPVLVFGDGRLARTHAFASFVNAVDLQAGRVAVATGEGQVALFGTDGTQLLNATLPMSVRSLRLTGDGSSVIVGGFSLTPGDLSGYVAYLDVTQRDPLRWTKTTEVGVGLVDTDRAGIYVAVLEESPPRDTVSVYEGATGRLLWTKRAEGNVARDDAGTQGGLAVSPDARVVAAAPLGGPVRMHDLTDGRVLWAYNSQGSTVVTFANDRPDTLVGNARLLGSGPFNAVILFDVDAERVVDEAAVTAALVVAATAAIAFIVLGFGYWRVRRSY